MIGRYLEPVGGMAARSVWGARYLPDSMSSAKHRLGPGASSRRAEASALASLMTAGLCDIVAAEALAEPWSISDVGTPWRNAGRLRRSVFRASVPYGDEPGQLLEPIEVGGVAWLAQLVAKTTPSAADPALRERAVELIAARARARALENWVHWHERL